MIRQENEATRQDNAERETWTTERFDDLKTLLSMSLTPEHPKQERAASPQASPSKDKEKTGRDRQDYIDSRKRPHGTRRIRRAIPDVGKYTTSGWKRGQNNLATDTATNKKYIRWSYIPENTSWTRNAADHSRSIPMKSFCSEISKDGAKSFLTEKI